MKIIKKDFVLCCKDLVPEKMSAITQEQYKQFIDGTFRTTWTEAEKLSAAEDEPEEPFKSKYKANDLLVLDRAAY